MRWLARARARRFRTLTRLLVGVVALAGCGATTHTAARPAQPVGTSCLREARRAADAARQVLRHYGADTEMPADLFLFDLQDAVAAFQRGRCPANVLDLGLSRRQQKRLLSHLPSGLARYLSWALRCRGACTPPRNLPTITAHEPSGAFTP